ncbi:hypothetical protein NX059_009089 [Plenodomus lindquistii]|nr:hypothetical protein NX059_009089 [Plenodomus lindquistii]
MRHALRSLNGVERKKDAQTTLSFVELAAPENAACSVRITNAGHEAIRHFRSSFAKHHQVKDTDYSLISLMFKVAQEDPMVMDMVIAIGLQETNSRRCISQSTDRRNSLIHYSSALRQLVDGILPGAGMKSLDVLYTTLWMMLYYEQQFGDPLCAAYTQHLRGIASLLQSQHAGQPITETSKGLWDEAGVQKGSDMTVYSARVLVWISFLDAAAASSGIGGQVITAILDTLLPRKTWSEGSSADTVQAVTKFHRFSGPLYRMAWGDAYPESEMLNDLEDREAYSLLAACVQLRYLTARLTTLQRIDPCAAARKAFDVEQSINHVRDTFCDLISLASKFAWEQQHSKRSVANVCAVVPMYYAVVLDFYRSTTPDQPKSERQLHALNEIMNLVFQGYKEGGDEAMIKVAWALFTAALETDDMIHRAWILERYAAISKYGRSFEHAHAFLLKYIPLQQQLGKRVDLREEMEKMPKFVLG